jgi:hypothetical protein
MRNRLSVIFKFKHENNVEKHSKYGPATLRCSDLSFKTYSGLSQSHDTVALKAEQM